MQMIDAEPVGGCLAQLSLMYQKRHTCLGVHQHNAKELSRPMLVYPYPISSRATAFYEPRNYSLHDPS